MNNIKFNDILSKKEINIKIDDMEIVLTVQNLSWPDFMESLEIEDLVERGIFRIRKVITDWNLVDDSDKKIEITKENIAKIPANIMLPIVESIKEYFGDQKKKITQKTQYSI